MAETAVAIRETGAALAEKVVIAGDLSKLTPEERMGYYTAVCESLGLNPLTRPFEFITLNNKLTLYATRGAADQLRKLQGITITRLERELTGDVYVVTAYGRDSSDREDASIGAVPVRGLAGEAMANAYMKAETKAKRRLTLSLAGLGMSDETEITSIPSAVRADVDPETGEIHKPLTLAERAAEKAAAVTAAVVSERDPAEEPPVDPGPGTSEVEVDPFPEFTAEPPRQMTRAAFVTLAQARGVMKQQIEWAGGQIAPGKGTAELSDAEWHRMADLLGLLEAPQPIEQP